MHTLEREMLNERLYQRFLSNTLSTLTIRHCINECVKCLNNVAPKGSGIYLALVTLDSYHIKRVFCTYRIPVHLWKSEIQEISLVRNDICSQLILKFDTEHRSLCTVDCVQFRTQWRGALMFSLICALNKRLSKQWWGWLFETPSCSFGRHCN